jgi:2-polyprenyl-6-methoxyphenol hydroxylase-like FAD-dependent oxidoreductase
VAWKLVGFAQDALAPEPNPVKVVLRHADGRLEQAQAPWLIDAGGAHSTVRTTLALAFEGRTFDQTYALGDLLVDGDLAEDEFHLFSTEHGSTAHGFLGLFPLGQRRFRIIAGTPPGDGRKGTAPRFRDMRWGSWFCINSRMVPHLRTGRVLLGGDAAHIHSPAAVCSNFSGPGSAQRRFGTSCHFESVSCAWAIAAVRSPRTTGVAAVCTRATPSPTCACGAGSRTGKAGERGSYSS